MKNNAIIQWEEHQDDGFINHVQAFYISEEDALRFTHEPRELAKAVVIRESENIGKPICGELKIVSIEYPLS